MVSKVTRVINATGLHARPATEFVNKANTFSSKITIRNFSDGSNKTVNAKSIVLLLTLGICQGMDVEITAVGPDEVEAVESLVALINTGFGE
ncbi:MAG: HPr family phosphocarrier protein [Pelolinea sp.]|nr:HPr family phosphocarrier protein [Pelolinea sp.]